MCPVANGVATRMVMSGAACAADEMSDPSMARPSEDTKILLFIFELLRSRASTIITDVVAPNTKSNQLKCFYHLRADFFGRPNDTYMRRHSRHYGARATVTKRRVRVS